MRWQAGSVRRGGSGREGRASKRMAAALPGVQPKGPPTNVKALGSRRVELSDPKASTAHWKALSVKLSERFPSYALPYMVEYGVYGLALSKARE